jgi:uncharacterized delta-60 repeat protein
VQEAEGRAVGVDPATGRIVVGGVLHGGAVHDFAFAVYTKTGGLDHTFSGDGKMVRPTADRGGLFRLAVLGTGRIVAVGATTAGVQKGQMLVEKYTRAGDFDSTFGGGHGIALVGFRKNGHPRDDLAFDVGIQSNGKIVVAGQSAGQDLEFAIARLRGNGTLDPAFHGGGVLTAFPENAAANGVAINNGTHKIVAVGQEFVSGHVDAMLAARYLGA